LALVGLSFLGSGLSIIAILDPAGAQMANDSDPFGVPPSFGQSAAILGGCVAVGMFGAILIWLACRRRGGRYLQERSFRARTHP
jgi:hypothetical protein